MALFRRIHKKLGRQEPSGAVGQSPALGESAHPPVTFTMKRPFRFRPASTLLHGIADAFADSSSEDDKVQLLSVLNPSTGFSNEDMSSTTSSSDESGCELDAAPLLQTESKTCRCLPEEATPVDPELPDRKHAFSSKEQATECGQDPDNKLEWTFTLYDFDGNGKVTKEDIVSLVRSIYEVLGSAKIPMMKSEQRRTDEKKENAPMGAFKVRLTLIAENAAECASSQAEKAAPKRKSGTEAGQPVRRNGGHSDGVYANLMDAFKKPRKNNCRNYQNSRRRSERAPMETKEDCAGCSHRDYVNLADLENCCSGHSFTAGHSIRHCDRHCNCAQAEDGKPREVSGRCDTDAEWQRTPRGKQGDLPNMSRVRNQAYYNANRAVAAAARVRFEPILPESLPAPPSIPAPEPSSLHQKKHRNRNRDKLRAMRQVRQWIANDGTAETQHCTLPSFVQHKHIHEHHHYIHG